MVQGDVESPQPCVQRRRDVGPCYFWLPGLRLQRQHHSRAGRTWKEIEGLEKSQLTAERWGHGQRSPGCALEEGFWGRKDVV